MVDLSALSVRRAAERLPPPPELGFGRHLGPLVVTSEHSDGSGWSPPRELPLEACGLHVASAAVQYGGSVFEGLKAYRGPTGAVHLFRPDAYAQRLQASAARLCLPTVERGRFLELCSRAVALHEPLLPPHGMGSLYVRPFLCATEPFIGIRAARRHALHLIVSPSSVPTMRPQRCLVEADRVRAAPGGLGAVKTGANYAAGLGPFEAARARGFDQVLFLDGLERTRLSESATTNVFVVLDDRIVTPPLDDALLAGVTRDTCITLLRERGYLVEERAPTLHELAAWSRRGRLRELFCTGTATAVLGVAELVGPDLQVTLAPGPVVAELRQALDAVEDGRAPCPEGWRVAVEPRAPKATAPRTREDAHAFAELWAAAWSRRDIEAVLAWFADDVLFESPLAVDIIGRARVTGKPALRDYWQRALSRIERIHFEIEDVAVEPTTRQLVIRYLARIDGRGRRASEHLTFDGNGRIVAGAAFHGAPLEG